MTEYEDQPTARRAFLRYLAGSPLVALASSPARALEWVLQSQGHDTISSPQQALNVMDFEPAARKKLPPAHFAYLATGVDDDQTVRVNHEGFSRLGIRARRLVDVRTIDTSVGLFGTTWETPIVLAPVSSQRAFHPEGEIAVAKAARAKGHLQILSTLTNSSIENVTAARGAPVWFQLYPTNDWTVARAMIKRAEAAGSPVLALTVDIHEGSNRETLRRGSRADTRQCSLCHTTGFPGFVRQKRMFDSLDLSNVKGHYLADTSWEVVKRLRDATKMKVVLKGIVTREDAALAVENGVDGIIVSNHGGRSEEANRSTIECLPEVMDGTSGRIPVLIDGGFRRGTDVFKALALGATAVCIGRPYVWGLGAFGQPGVEAVLDILRRELRTIMRQAGTPSVTAITRAFVVDRSR